MKTLITSTLTSLILCLFLQSCTTSDGYTNIEELYKESLIALKSNDEDKIKIFVTKLFPDKATLNYMKKNGISYRGLPHGLDERPELLDEGIEKYTLKLKEYADDLQQKGILQDLEFVQFDRSLLPEEPLESSDTKNMDVLFNEPFGEFISPSTGEKARYKLGELIRIDGKWKVFTSPKLW